MGGKGEHRLSRTPLHHPAVEVRWRASAALHASLCHRPPLPLSPDSGSASEGEESGQEEGGGATTPPSPQQPPPQAGSQAPNTQDLFGGESSSYVPLSNITMTSCHGDMYNVVCNH